MYVRIIISHTNVRLVQPTCAYANLKHAHTIHIMHTPVFKEGVSTEDNGHRTATPSALSQTNPPSQNKTKQKHKSPYRSKLFLGHLFP